MLLTLPVTHSKQRRAISHHYFDLNAEVVFGICQSDMKVLLGTIEKIIKDMDWEKLNLAGSLISKPPLDVKRGLGELRYHRVEFRGHEPNCLFNSVSCTQNSGPAVTTPSLPKISGEEQDGGDK
jgi:hypothetical protein